MAQKSGEVIWGGRIRAAIKFCAFNMLVNALGIAANGDKPPPKDQFFFA